jgi:hypothetical protein
LEQAAECARLPLSDKRGLAFMSMASVTGVCSPRKALTYVKETAFAIQK